MDAKKKFKVDLNSIDNIRELLQQIYHEADEQIKASVDEQNKLRNSTKMEEEIMDGRAKYAKCMKDYLDIKQKAMDTKLDIAKLMTSIYQNNGNVKAAVEDVKATKSISTDFLKTLRAQVDESVEAEKGGGENYDMGKLKK